MPNLVVLAEEEHCFLRGDSLQIIQSPKKPDWMRVKFEKLNVINVEKIRGIRLVKHSDLAYGPHTSVFLHVFLM